MRCLRNVLILIILFFFSTFSLSFAQSVTFTATVNGASFVFGGYTSPNSLVIFSENSVIIGTTTSSSTGAFSKTITAVTPGIHSITIASSASNSSSGTPVEFDLVIIANQQMSILNIYLPPSLQINGTSFDRNDVVTISGYSKPNSVITIHINGNSSLIRNVLSDSVGSYSLSLPASELASGNYSVNAELVVTGIIDNSTLTKVYNFKVNNGISSEVPPLPSAISLCPNPYQRLCFFDKKKLGYLDEREEFLNFLTGYIKFSGQDFDIIYDINEDKHVNSLDLSIVLYYWRGDNTQISGDYNLLALNNTAVLGLNDSNVKGVSTQKDPEISSQNSEWSLLISFLLDEFYVVLFVLLVFVILILLRKLIRKIDDSR